jgi:hypothetical protein
MKYVKLAVTQVLTKTTKIGFLLVTENEVNKFMLGLGRYIIFYLGCQLFLVQPHHQKVMSHLDYPSSTFLLMPGGGAFLLASYFSLSTRQLESLAL